MAASASSTEGDMGFQVAPMVDVVFVLMLFFMASAGQQISEKELSIALPAPRHPSGSPTPTVINTVLIDISAEGQVTMNGQPFGTPADKNLAGLRDWLTSTIAQFGNQDPVFIRPSPQTRHERLMDVLSAAQASNVTKLSFL
ncbi:MAG: biopolymer transporter ExbD [Chthoniobacter sp.]|nr:biopolymer transporter ExbD [Chthoniobacter sp.]